MYIYFILLGLNSFLTQTILLRETLIAINGNEIVFAMFLSLWLMVVGFGSILAGKTISSGKNNQQWVYKLLPLTVIITIGELFLLNPLLKILIPVQGQLVNIPNLILLSLIILAPGALILGFLFPVMCQLLKTSKNPVNSGYLNECLGFIIGGALFAFLIGKISNLNFLIVLFVINIFFVLRYNLKIFIPLLLMLVFGYTFLIDSYAQLYEKKYEAQRLILTKDSKYGRFEITKSFEQENYYWNGQYIASSDNTLYAEEVVNFILLQHPEPKRILLVGGILNGVLKKLHATSQVKQIDCVEINAQIIQQAPINSPDPKVNYYQDDIINFLRNSDQKYDMIIIDVPDPQSLEINRYYLSSFINLLSSIMVDSKSVLVQSSSGGVNNLIAEIGLLTSIISRTTNPYFVYSTIIPSIKNLYIASNSNYISNDPVELINRKQNQGIKSPVFNEILIKDRCNLMRIKQIEQALAKYNTGRNTLDYPAAYLTSIMLWLRHLGIRIEDYFNLFNKSPVLLFILSLSGLFVFLRAISALSHSSTLPWDLVIFNASFINFVFEIMLLNIFQSKFGLLYYYIYLFSLLFMLGLVFGFILQRLIKLCVLIPALFNLFLIILLLNLFEVVESALPLFILNFLVATCEGYLLAYLLVLKFRTDRIKSGVSFYSLDSIGAMTGGLIVSIILYPLYGFRTAVLFILILATINLLILLPHSLKQFRKNKH